MYIESTTHIDEQNLNLCIVGDYVFQQCSAISSVVFANGLRTISSNIFDMGGKSTVLTAVVIPSTIKAFGELFNFPIIVYYLIGIIGAYVFNQCSALTSMTLTVGLQVIGTNTFHGLFSLQSLIIPSTLTSIGITYADIKIAKMISMQSLVFSFNYLNSRLTEI